MLRRRGLTAAAVVGLLASAVGIVAASSQTTSQMLGKPIAAHFSVATEAEAAAKHTMGTMIVPADQSAVFIKAESTPLGNALDFGGTTSSSNTLFTAKTSDMYYKTGQAGTVTISRLTIPSGSVSDRASPTLGIQGDSLNFSVPRSLGNGWDQMGLQRSLHFGLGSLDLWRTSPPVDLQLGDTRRTPYNFGGSDFNVANKAQAETPNRRVPRRTDAQLRR